MPHGTLFSTWTNSIIQLNGLHGKEEHVPLTCMDFHYIFLFLFFFAAGHPPKAERACAALGHIGELCFLFLYVHGAVFGSSEWWCLQKLQDGAWDEALMEQAERGRLCSLWFSSSAAHKSYNRLSFPAAKMFWQRKKRTEMEGNSSHVSDICSSSTSPIHLGGGNSTQEIMCHVASHVSTYWHFDTNN